MRGQARDILTVPGPGAAIVEAGVCGRGGSIPSCATHTEAAITFPACDKEAVP